MSIVVQKMTIQDYDQVLALRRDRIAKCHIFVFADHHDTIAFWKDIGWTQRVELVMMSRYTINKRRRKNHEMSGLQSPITRNASSRYSS
jgi:hypothetical protein